MCCLNRLLKKTEEEATLCQAGGGGGCEAGGDGPKWIRNLLCNCEALIDTWGRRGGAAVKFPSNCIKDTLIRLIKNREAVSFFPQKA